MSQRDAAASSKRLMDSVSPPSSATYCSARRCALSCSQIGASQAVRMRDCQTSSGGGAPGACDAGRRPVCASQPTSTSAGKSNPSKVSGRAVVADVENSRMVSLDPTTDCRTSRAPSGESAQPAATDAASSTIAAARRANSCRPVTAALGDAGGLEGPAGEHPGEVIAVVRRGVQVGGGVRSLGGLLSSLSR